MSQYKILILLAILCGYAFCQQAVTLSPTSSTVATIKKNTDLIIKLKGNPTTGYGWYLENANQLDNAIQANNLSSTGSALDYVKDPAPAGYVGVGGTYNFEFTALDVADNVSLRFVYKRPWELTTANKITVTLKITE